MKCPFCGSETKIVDTEKYPCVVVRVRKCRKCGAALTTDEIPRNIPTKIKDPS
jgi:transcriptional regulator NrdR family protein